MLCIICLIVAFQSLTQARIRRRFHPVKPWGRTGCANGGEYTFFVRHGRENKLVIELEGGGACWDAASCSLPIYLKDVNVTSQSQMLNDPNNNGIHSDSDINPIQNWTHVFVPYCTGDIHTGNVSTTYSDHLTVNHFGKFNVEAALRWAKWHVPNPEKTLTLGCSAGSVGSIIWAPTIMQKFPKAKNFHFGDSYVGVFTPQQWNGGLENWNMHGALPTFIPGLNKVASKWTRKMMSQLVTLGANYFSDSTFSLYTSNSDVVQTSFYHIGGGIHDWTSMMREELKDIVNQTRNTAYFIAPGNAHCRSQTNDFYAVKSKHQYLRDWLNSILTENAYDRTVDCIGEKGCQAKNATTTSNADELHVLSEYFLKR